MAKLRALAKSVKCRVNYYRALAADPRTPKTSKWLIGIAIGYLLSPIDIIPDFIPVVGYLDDLLIVPSLIWVASLLIPAEAKLAARALAAEKYSGEQCE